VRLLLAALLAACGAPREARYVAIAYDGKYSHMVVDRAMCESVCARFLRKGETATCTIGRADEGIDHRYGVQDFTICRMEPK
jgi:hypothetical protein